MANRNYTTEQARSKRRARDLKYKARLRAERDALEVDTLRAELKAARAQEIELQDKLDRQAELHDNLADPRAPLDLDHFVRSFKGESAGTMSRSKRQEYNKLQGDFADFLADPAATDDETVRKLATYGAGLAEDENRFTLRRAARITSIQAAREALFLRNFTARCAVLFADKIVPSGFAKAKPTTEPERIVTLHISDTHVGARLDAKEFPRGSDPVSEARRLGLLALETADYKTRYREKTKLYLLLNGDLIAGLLGHSNAREEDTLTEQFTRCLHMFAQLITYLAQHYPSVTVYCQAGNHGRNILVHPGRATAAKHDSYEHMIFVALQVACRTLANVSFDIPKTQYCSVPYFDTWGLVTHGDTLINVGNPASSVNVRSILGQINNINASGALGHRYGIVATGHVHTAMSLEHASGTLLVNGAATPPNGHAISLGFFDACGQWLWESTRQYPVGDMRLLRLDSSVDSDASYERIITPVV